MCDRGIFVPLAAVVLAGCGYVGDPLPPSLDIPRKVTDLRVRQHADKVLVDFTIPELTTEGLPLKLSKVELVANPPNEALNTANLKPGPVRLEYPAGEWRGRTVAFRVRTFSRKGRDSGWSDSVSLSVIPPLEAPSGLKAENVAEGVRLTWAVPSAPPELKFRIRRQAGKEAPSVVATASGHEWVDTDTRYGVAYKYTLQSVVESGAIAAASDLSEPVAITPVDIFPPAVPRGLTAVAGASSVELTWDRNAEPDLRGYSVYRATGDEPWERLNGILETPAYSDREVKSGVTYRYAVSSVDQSGNASQRSGAVEVAMP